MLSVCSQLFDYFFNKTKLPNMCFLFPVCHEPFGCFVDMGFKMNFCESFGLIRSIKRVVERMWLWGVVRGSGEGKW